ncbi:hypothetical protein P7C70_g340, partial [Phenoliferia sp. Uapishka_3]
MQDPGLAALTPSGDVGQRALTPLAICSFLLDTPNTHVSQIGPSSYFLPLAIMGNSPSTPQSRSSRTSAAPDSPVTRQISNNADHASTARSNSTRRKKSIELSDVDTSLTFTSSPAVSSIRALTNHRRKQSDRVTDISGSGDEDMLEASEGTLRGAMQGRAEHVVYGPRRSDSPLRSSTGTGGAFSPKPTAIQLPSLNYLNPLRDPDDTVHPDFTASPRLTADVLLSSDQMPVMISPVAEDIPKESPFSVSTPLARVPTPTSLSQAATILAPSPSYPFVQASNDLLPPRTSPPY